MGKSVSPVRVKELLWSLLGIGFFLVFIQANAPSLDSDGIHYAAVAKEISRSNRWLLPFDPVVGGPHYFHFPMCVWPTALLFQWFGASPAVAKLYAMIMTLVAVGGLFLLGRMLANPWVGWCAGIAFLLTNHVLRIARQCRPDLPLIAYLVWAFVGLIYAQKRSRIGYLLLGFASLGAIMTKEMVGLVPLAVAVAYFLLRGKWRELVNPLFLVSWVLAIGPVIAWIFAEQALFHDTLLRNYLAQNFDLLMHAEHLTKPWTYYGWAILDKYWYLLPFALAGAWLAIGRIRRKEEPGWWIVLLWALAFPIGFSLARHKVHYYILPTYAATALLVGLAADRWIRESWRPRIVRALVGLTVAASVILACFPVPIHKTRYAETTRIVPKIDPILQEAPGEVIVVRQDVASLLFYSNAVTRATSAHEEHLFRQALAAPTASHRRYCLIGRAEWESVDPEVRSRWEPIVEDGGRFLLKQEPARTP